jgi:hypothetical protein
MTAIQSPSRNLANQNSGTRQESSSPDTDDSRRAIVRADSPDSRSASRTTVRSPR